MKESGKLSELYKQLWNNRSLLFSNVKGENTVNEAMRSELKDELTHPRTRKKPAEKYAMAVKRILDSPLEDSDQLLLIREFTIILEEIKKES